MSKIAKSKIKALGEVALRVNDLDAMQKFYAEKIGLETLKRFEHAVFFRISEGHDGHTTILALFDRKADNPEMRVAKETSSLDHLAFTISLADYQSEKERLESHGLTVTETTHAWVKWRSLYVTDPEGNTVELVCYDQSVE